MSSMSSSSIEIVVEYLQLYLASSFLPFQVPVLKVRKIKTTILRVMVILDLDAKSRAMHVRLDFVFQVSN